MSFVAYWPILYRLSRSVRPGGCLLFSGAYLYSYFKFISPLGAQFLQSRLNTEAAPFAQKYGVSADDAKYYQQ